MDKPISLSVKDFLIRKMSIKLNTPEKVIEAVVNHQFQSATLAFADQKSVELSGFGKFLFNEKKAHKLMEKYLSQKEAFERYSQDECQSETRRRNASLKLASAISNIEHLKPKLYGQAFTDLRGVEERFDSSQEEEGAYSEDFKRKNKDLQGL